MTPHTDSHGINSLELPDMTPEGLVDTQMLRLQILQIYHELVQDQLSQGTAPPPSQPEPHTGQQLFLGGEDPSGALDPSDHNMLWNLQPDNVPSPPQHPSYAGQQQFPVGEDPTGVLNPSEVNMPTGQPASPPYHTQVEALPVQEDAGPGVDPLEFAAPVQEQAAGPVQHLCHICGRPFDRPQERNRHLRTLLPHFICCPFPQCPYRCDRTDNLVTHWRKRHPNSNQALQQQEYQIYDPNPLVTRVVSGQIPLELAMDNALSAVQRRAQELGKEVVWGGNLWGRRQRPHVYPQ